MFTAKSAILTNVFDEHLNFVKPLPIYVSLTFCSRIAICCVPLSLH